jgi:hypothetical protein
LNHNDSIDATVKTDAATDYCNLGTSFGGGGSGSGDDDGDHDDNGKLCVTQWTTCNTSFAAAAVTPRASAVNVTANTEDNLESELKQIENNISDHNDLDQLSTVNCLDVVDQPSLQPQSVDDCPVDERTHSLRSHTDSGSSLDLNVTMTSDQFQRTGRGSRRGRRLTAPSISPATSFSSQDIAADQSGSDKDCSRRKETCKVQTSKHQSDNPSIASNTDSNQQTVVVNLSEVNSNTSAIIRQTRSVSKTKK